MTEVIREPERNLGCKRRRALPTRPVTILLVDDDPLIRSLGQELLAHLGYRVETAADGAEALKCYRRLGGVDLVVLDYYLPGLNGCQVLKEFKAMDEKVRVLIASGFFSPREVDCLRQEGALGLIYKPYRLADLETQIQRVLSGQPGF